VGEAGVPQDAAGVADEARRDKDVHLREFDGEGGNLPGDARARLGLEDFIEAIEDDFDAGRVVEPRAECVGSEVNEEILIAGKIVEEVGGVGFVEAAQLDEE